jgi:hypothetical protein
LVLDVDWLLASGYDLHTLVTAIDVVARDWGRATRTPWQPPWS